MDRCKTQDKQRYPSKGAAIRAALSYSKKRGTALRVYRHGACGGWHLTKRPKRDNDSEVRAS